MKHGYLRTCESFVVGWAFLPVEVCCKGRSSRMESGKNTQPTMIHGLSVDKSLVRSVFDLCSIRGQIQKLVSGQS